VSCASRRDSLDLKTAQQWSCELLILARGCVRVAGRTRSDDVRWEQRLAELAASALAVAAFNSNERMSVDYARSARGHARDLTWERPALYPAPFNANRRQTTPSNDRPDRTNSLVRLQISTHNDHCRHIRRGNQRVRGATPRRALRPCSRRLFSSVA